MSYVIPKKGQHVKVTFEGVVEEVGADDDFLLQNAVTFRDGTVISPGDGDVFFEVLPEVYEVGCVAALRTGNRSFVTVFRMKDGSLGEEWYDGNGCIVEVGPSDDLTLLVRANGFPVYRAGES